MEQRLFAEPGYLLNPPEPISRPSANGIYWIKASIEDHNKRNNKGFSIPSWFLCEYSKEGWSGNRGQCLHAIISVTNKSTEYECGGRDHPSFWGDEGDEVWKNTWRTVVVDYEGPVMPPPR